MKCLNHGCFLDHDHYGACMSAHGVPFKPQLAPGQCPEGCFLNIGHTGTHLSAYGVPFRDSALPNRQAAKSSSIYVIGSMRNPRVPEVAKALRDAGHDAFDDWYSSGPESDDKWQEYEKARGRTYREALAGVHARDVFELDKKHLDRCDACVLVAPAGKSGHLELGYMIGRGKPGYILLDGEPERFDIMYQFATGIFVELDEMLRVLPVVLK